MFSVYRFYYWLICTTTSELNENSYNSEIIYSNIETKCSKWEKKHILLAWHTRRIWIKVNIYHLYNTNRKHNLRISFKCIFIGCDRLQRSRIAVLGVMSVCLGPSTLGGQSVSVHVGRLSPHHVDAPAAWNWCNYKIQ